MMDHHAAAERCVSLPNVVPRETNLKGPFERLKYDLRRVWECPVCRHKARTGGQVTSVLCRCQEEVDPTKRAWMKLVDDSAKRVGGQ